AVSAQLFALFTQVLRVMFIGVNFLVQSFRLFQWFLCFQMIINHQCQCCVVKLTMLIPVYEDTPSHCSAGTSVPCWPKNCRTSICESTNCTGTHQSTVSCLGRAWILGFGFVNIVLHQMHIK